MSSSPSLPSASSSITGTIALGVTSSVPPINPPRTPSSCTPRTRTISLRARRIASSSAFRIVPEVRNTRNTQGRSRPPLGRFWPAAASPVAGTCDIYVRADQTRRKDARGQRMIAVEVAGERYFTALSQYSVYFMNARLESNQEKIKIEQDIEWSKVDEHIETPKSNPKVYTKPPEAEQKRKCIP